MALAKTTRPSARGVVPRPRLFRLLDRGRDRPLTWVQAPPGSGKTSLVAGYIRARRLRCLWYQVDESDADLASFFHYLGEAAPRRKHPLPALIPDHLPLLPAFARPFFRGLFDRLRPPIVLVFDSYHRIPHESPLHEVVAEALAEIPRGIRIIVASRTGPPPGLARLRAARMIHLIGGEELRLTARETEAIVRAARPRVGRDVLARMQASAGGWTAGLVLLLEQLRAAGPDLAAGDRRGTEAIFDYFAAEIFKRAEPDTQRLLLRTAHLSRFTVAMAERLSGLPETGRILADLHREHYFTNRYGDNPPTYEYHALFREFLLARARETLARPERSDLERAAAAVLQDAGQDDDAVRLLVDAEDWAGLVSLITFAAPAAVAAARGQTVLRWIERVPWGLQERDPWLLYWRAVCRSPVNLTEGRRDAERAFRIFRQVRERTGALLSWAAAVSAYVHEAEDLAPLDAYLAELEPLLADGAGFPSPETEIVVTTATLGALVLRQPANGRVHRWAERAAALVREVPEGEPRDLLALQLIAYRYWTGDLSEAHRLGETMEESLRRREAPPLTRTALRMLVTRLRWLTARPVELRAVEEAVRLARSHGLAPHRSLVAEGACAAFSAGDLDAARRLVERFGPRARRGPQHDAAYFHFLEGWDASLRDDLPAAVRHSGESVQLFVRLGCPLVEAVARAFHAQLLHESGDPSDADAHLTIASRIARDSGFAAVLYPVRLAEARVALDRQDEATGVRVLAEAMALGRKSGFFSLYGWRPRTMAVLCAKALETGIEVDYVRELIRKRSLPPDGVPPDAQAWPWPVRIRTLGRFEVERDGRPIAFSGKAQKRPLALLKTLLSLGGEEVGEGQVADLLWPDADGDAAQQALSTTLHRLRRLLGSDDAVRRQAGRLSLGRKHCWLDVWAVDHLLGQAERAVAGPRVTDRSWTRSAQLTEMAVRLHGGDFLADDPECPWAARQGERIRHRLLARLQAVARHWQERGEPEKAVECYRRALDIHPCSEECCRALMRAYQHLGRRDEALSVYTRCTTLLQETLGITPSPQTVALLQILKTG